MNSIIFRSNEVNIRCPKPETSEGPDQVKTTRNSRRGSAQRKEARLEPSTNLKELDLWDVCETEDSWTTER
jgi:hypothetical protein